MRNEFEHNAFLLLLLLVVVVASNYIYVTQQVELSRFTGIEITLKRGASNNVG